MTDATLRDAASILLLQGTGDELRVLMGMRGAGHRFMPNHLVFPGGAVDEEDVHAVLASPPAPALLARLGAGDAGLGRALAVAAARELEEETGLHLGHPPALDRIGYLCRAVTPEGRPIRFDARFLVIDAALAQGTLAGSGELENLSWYRLADALALDLAYPTRMVLEQLRRWLAGDPEGRAGTTITPTLRERSWADE